MRMDQGSPVIVVSCCSSLACPSLFLKRICVVEAAAIVVDVPTADSAASTHVPELLTWRDDRDFCGELSAPSTETSTQSYDMATQARGPPGTVPVNKEGVPNRT